MKKNIVIFGHTGQLGRSLIKNFENNFKLNKNFTILKRRFNLQNITKIPKNSVIINCAAYTNVDQSEVNKDEANLINNLLVKETSLVCRKKNCLLIHFSSDYVFGGNKRGYTETDKLKPINYYGYTKLLGEKAIKETSCNHIIFRVSWLYSIYGTNFIKKIFQKIINNEKIMVVNDQYGSPTSCNLISKVLNKIIFDKNWYNKKKLYHLSSMGRTNWYNIAKFVIKYSKKKIKKNSSTLEATNSKKFKTIAKRPKNSYLISKKIQNELNHKINNWRYYMKDVLDELILVNEKKNR
ncbi:dTDP-4-dehydrorhamnose reductase [Candidatus Pelagibacter communis]|uniref:dTDP-4-dehydrorhamnose reductase n=1 Tax=Pelagibacter ubique TaxID=198252 RepID=UPI000B146B87|nr:dTDP-4-dehydrorhamnose reductase [Candidatus Pelagibacter ubique]